MGIDAIALAISKSPNRARTESLVCKELGVNPDQLLKQTKES